MYLNVYIDLLIDNSIHTKAITCKKFTFVCCILERYACKTKSFIMKKILLFLAFLSTIMVSAQVGIGTNNPNSSSALDVSSNNSGVLIPRLTTAQRDAISNPAEGLLVYNTDTNCLSQNTGTTTTPDWVCISGNVVRFFYLPSLNIDVSSTGTFTVNLYQEYRSQFSSPLVSSTGATGIPFFSEATDIEYYVTDYDTSALTITSISENGVLTYTVSDSDSASECSFVNVVLVVK